MFGRRVADAAAPRERRRLHEVAVDPRRRRRVHPVERLGRVVVGVQLVRVREEQRQAPSPALKRLEFVVHRDRGAAEVRPGARLRQRAARQLVAAAAVGALEEHRVGQVVVGRQRQVADHRPLHLRVVEAGQHAGNQVAPLLPAGVLAGRAQLGRRLVVEPERRLRAEDALLRPGHLVVVAHARHADVRHRILLQDVQPGLVEAGSRESCRGRRRPGSSRWCRPRCRRSPIDGILDEVVERAVLVESSARSRRSARARSESGSAARRCRPCAARTPGCRRRTSCCCRPACRSGRRSRSPGPFPSGWSSALPFSLLALLFELHSESRLTS